MFYDARQKSLEGAKQSIESREKQELNYDTLAALILRRYPNRPNRGGSADISALLSELTEYGFNTVPALVDLLDGGGDYEHTASAVLTGVGIVRGTLHRARPDALFGTPQQKGMTGRGIRKASAE
jgi:hypothetical protein